MATEEPNSKYQETASSYSKPLNGIASVSDFINLLRYLKERYGDRIDEYSMFFRGHADFRWKLRPSVYRSRNGNPSDTFVDYEANMSEELIRNCPNDFLECKNSFDKLVKMQHYGLPTRLLDITLNPLVSLYFAAQPIIDAESSTVYNENGKEEPNGTIFVFLVKKAVIYDHSSDKARCLSDLSFKSSEEVNTMPYIYSRNIESESKISYDESRNQTYRAPAMPKDYDKVICVLPKLDNPRIVRQQGAFFLFGIQDGNKELMSTLDVQCEEFTVKANAKAEILNELDQLSINQKFCFPEIDEVASYIKHKYKYMK